MKLLSLTVNKNDTTSFYRANGVMNDLKNQMNIEITSMDISDLKDMSWATLVLYDVVFMQRPYQNSALQLAQYCKELNVPVWVDYDDNLFEIPIDNQKGYDLFSSKNIQQNIIKIIELAKVVSVSTENLRKVLEKLNDNIKIIPNALNMRLFDYRKKQKSQKTVMWRGSNTHQLDIFIYAEDIFKLTEKYSDFDFKYFGFYPWFIPMTENSVYIKPTDPMIYFQHLYKMAPRIMQIPLNDSVFNRCKSNIAFIEGTFAGAICLVPEWDEWRVPGAVTYKGVEDYGEKMELLLNGNLNINKRVAIAWEYIMDNLTLEKVNKQRVELLNEIV